MATLRKRLSQFFQSVPYVSNDSNTHPTSCIIPDGATSACTGKPIAKSSPASPQKSPKRLQKAKSMTFGTLIGDITNQVKNTTSLLHTNKDALEVSQPAQPKDQTPPRRSLRARTGLTSRSKSDLKSKRSWRYLRTANESPSSIAGVGSDRNTQPSPLQVNLPGDIKETSPATPVSSQRSSLDHGCIDNDVYFQRCLSPPRAQPDEAPKIRGPQIPDRGSSRLLDSEEMTLWPFADATDPNAADCTTNTKPLRPEGFAAETTSPCGHSNYRCQRCMSILNRQKSYEVPAVYLVEFDPN